jgi:hypothetical protein
MISRFTRCIEDVRTYVGNIEIVEGGSTQRERVYVAHLYVPVRAVHRFAQCTRNTKTRLRTPIATTSNSTNMDPILAAIDYIESRELGENISYTQVTSQYSVNRSTLSRRHRRVMEPRNVKDLKQQKLSPKQELELIQYIKGLTKRGLLPTREIIKNFSLFVAKTELSES